MEVLLFFGPVFGIGIAMILYGFHKLAHKPGEYSKKIELNFCKLWQRDNDAPIDDRTSHFEARLMSLNQLHKSGAVSDAEFNRLRQDILREI